jgi:hypothetical protein
MFLSLNHQKLEFYEASRAFVLECYKFSKYLGQMKNLEFISSI